MDVALGEEKVWLLPGCKPVEKPKATIYLCGSWCNLEDKQKLKNKGQLLLGGDPKATTNLCGGQKGQVILEGDPEGKKNKAEKKRRFILSYLFDLNTRDKL